MTKSETTSDQAKSTIFSWRRLGFLQLSIITSLWKKEMYGLELIKHLTLTGYKVQENQLYPTLYRLESIGLLEQSRLQDVKGKKRKYFKSTEIGKKRVMEYFINFHNLFNGLITEKISFVYEEIFEYIGDITSGMIIADFSYRNSEEEFQTVVETGKIVAPIGRVFMTNLIDQREITEDRIKRHGVENTVSLLDIENGRCVLPDNNVDLAVSAFVISQNNNQWIVPEIARILKSGCYGVIAALLFLEELDVRFASSSLRMDFMKEIDPLEVRFGINPKELEEIIIENDLIIVDQKEGNGAIYYKVQKK